MIEIGAYIETAVQLATAGHGDPWGAARALCPVAAGHELSDKAAETAGEKKMSKGVNEITLIGNLGRDPEMRYTQDGTAVCKLRMAVTERRKKGDNYEDQTEWFSVVAFGKSAEAIAQYMSKGSRMYVKGRVQNTKWTDKDGNERYGFDVVADRTMFLDAKGEGGGQRQRQPQRGNELQNSTPRNQGFDDQDLPF